MRYQKQDTPPGIVWTLGSYPTPWRNEESASVDAKLFNGLCAQSEAMKHCITSLISEAGSSKPVWLLGERGTGRHTLAHALHLAGAHRQGPFVRLRCRYLSSAELQREILGDYEHPGVIERAKTGTLYIEDAECLSPWEHGLLADLMSERLHGSNWRTQVPRIILSSGVDLRERMTDWYWLQQLFRVTVPRPIMVPALSERAEDRLELAHRMLQQVQRDEGIGTVYIRGFSPVAARWISLQDWVGNLCEMRDRLRQALERRTAQDAAAPWLELEHFAKPKAPFKRLLKLVPQRWLS